jgi:hypothetical protein
MVDFSKGHPPDFGVRGSIKGEDDLSKRFTDTEIWNKEWYMSLSPTNKCAINYIKDHCDCVGVWPPNLKLAEFVIGDKPDWNLLLKECNHNIEKLPNGKWFLPDFCNFQYGHLTDACPPHKKYIEELKHHGLLERVLKGYPKGSLRVQEKEKEKEEEKEKESKIKYASTVHMTEKEYNTLVELIGKDNTRRCITKLSDYKGSKGKTYKDDYRAIRTWTIETVTGHETAWWEAERQRKMVESKKIAERKDMGERLSPEKTKALIQSVTHKMGVVK